LSRKQSIVKLNTDHTVWVCDLSTANSVDGLTLPEFWSSTTQTHNVHSVYITFI